jgi:uncharacterized membrane protein
MVVPEWGLYSNLIAQVICQISSHIIIHFHHRIVSDFRKNNIQTQPTTTGSIEENDVELHSSTPLRQPRPNTTEVLSDFQHDALCYHAFRRAHRDKSNKLVTRWYVSPLLVTLVLITSILVVLGCVLPTFSVTIFGVLGVLVELERGVISAENPYSVFGILETLFGQAKVTGTFGDYFGLGTLSIIVVLTVVITPIMQVMALLAQWFMSLNHRQRKKMSRAIEIIRAWQYVDVYLLAIVVGSWQLAPISSTYN